MGSGGPCQKSQGWVALASEHWKVLGMGRTETGLSPLTRAHHPLSRPPCGGNGPAMGTGKGTRGIALQGKSHFKYQQCLPGRGKTHGLWHCSGFKLYCRRIKIKERNTERDTGRKKKLPLFYQADGKVQGIRIRLLLS